MNSGLDTLKAKATDLARKSCQPAIVFIQRHLIINY